MLSKGASPIAGEWNRTHQRLPARQVRSELFEARAEQTPEAQAVVFGTKR